MRRGLIVLALVAFVRPAFAAEYWADPAAAAGGDGTQAKPFKTIGDAVAVMSQGDTLWLMGGTYTENPNFYQLPGSGGRTYVKAVDGQTPVIDGGGASDFVVQSATPSVTFQGLTVKNGGVGFEFYQSDGGQVIDCKTEATGSAVEFYFASQGYVYHSDLTGSVAGKGSDGTIVESNRIHGSGAEGITLHDNSKNCKYLHNVVYDNTSVNIYLDSCSNMLVDGNLVYMSGDPPAELAGIQLADESYPDVTSPVLSDITIVNNVLFNNYYGIVFWEGNFPGQSGLKNVTIANNTIVNSKSVGITWDAGAHQGSSVRNNIFAGASGVGQLLLVAKSTSGVTLDHNLWSLQGVQEPFNWGGGTTYDHAGWVTTSQQGAGDVLADPGFSGAWSLPDTNFDLAAGSGAIDTGASNGVDHDYLDRVRPFGQATDIGAFEYGAPPGDGGVTPPPGGGGSSGTGGGSSGAGGSAAGNGGATASGGSANSGGTKAGSGGAHATGSNDSGGCGCHVGSDTSRAPALVWLALVLSIGVRRRRR